MSDKKRILFIEDEPLQRLASVMELQRAGHEVIELDGHSYIEVDEATGKISYEDNNGDLHELNASVDAIISDNSTDGVMQGEEFASVLQKHDYHLPFILATGEPDAIERCRNKGTINNGVLKPYMSETLVAAIENAIEQGPPSPNGIEGASHEGTVTPPSKERGQGQ
ncbi:MAG: hypothetical protein CMM94_06050 [Rickettsiales bacterium]|nr:hypothetical protein [Rickettsiales bacterium]